MTKARFSLAWTCRTRAAPANLFYHAQIFGAFDFYLGLFFFFDICKEEKKKIKCAESLPNSRVLDLTTKEHANFQT